MPLGVPAFHYKKRNKTPLKAQPKSTFEALSK